MDQVVESSSIDPGKSSLDPKQLPPKTDNADQPATKKEESQLMALLEKLDFDDDPLDDDDDEYSEQDPLDQAIDDEFDKLWDEHTRSIEDELQRQIDEQIHQALQQQLDDQIEDYFQKSLEDPFEAYLDACLEEEEEHEVGYEELLYRQVDRSPSPTVQDINANIRRVVQQYQANQPPNEEVQSDDWATKNTQSAVK